MISNTNTTNLKRKLEDEDEYIETSEISETNDIKKVKL